VLERKRSATATCAVDFILCRTFARKFRRILESAEKTCPGLEAAPQCDFESAARSTQPKTTRGGVAFGFGGGITIGGVNKGGKVENEKTLFFVIVIVTPVVDRSMLKMRTKCNQFKTSVFFLFKSREKSPSSPLLAARA